MPPSSAVPLPPSFVCDCVTTFFVCSPLTTLTIAHYFASGQEGSGERGGDMELSGERGHGSGRADKGWIGSWTVCRVCRGGRAGLEE